MQLILLKKTLNASNSRYCILVPSQDFKASLRIMSRLSVFPYLHQEELLKKKKKRKEKEKKQYPGSPLEDYQESVLPKWKTFQPPH